MWSDCYFRCQSDHFHERRIIPCHHSHWASRKRGDYETNPRCQERYNLSYYNVCLFKTAFPNRLIFGSCQGHRELLAIYEDLKNKAENVKSGLFSGLKVFTLSVNFNYLGKLRVQLKLQRHLKAKLGKPVSFFFQLWCIWSLWKPNAIKDLHLEGSASPRFKLQRTCRWWCQVEMQAETSQWCSIRLWLFSAFMKKGHRFLRSWPLTIFSIAPLILVCGFAECEFF